MRIRVAAAFFFLALPALAATPQPPPPAPLHPVTDALWGTKVTDPYRWMETPASPELASYMRAQNDYTQAMLNAMPGRKALHDAIYKDLNALTSVYWMTRTPAGNFFMEVAPGQQTAKLRFQDAKTGAIRTLIDPDHFIINGVPEAINFFQPSSDGVYVAYGVSAGGSENASLHVLNVATGADMGVDIPRVEGDNGGFLPVSWLPGNKSFVYYQLQKLKPTDPLTGHFQKSRDYLHHLGANPDGTGDKAVFGYGVDPKIDIGLNQDALIKTVPGCAYAFAMLTENESDNVIDAIYITPIADLAAGHPHWHQIATQADHVAAIDAQGGMLYLMNSANAPRYQILSTPLSHPDLAHAKIVLKQSDMVLQGIGAAKDALYAYGTLDGYGKILRISYDGGAATTLPVSDNIRIIATDPSLPGALIHTSAWTQAPAWLAYDPATGAATNTNIQPAPDVDLSNVTATEVNAVSYDGTMVPLSIIGPKNMALDGSHPTLLIGYGSYGITLNPSFLIQYKPWFDRGGIIAIAHPRGGGWYGEGWHQAGMKLTKLNTVYDFIACAQYLIDNHYTKPALLGGEGGSAGGITIMRAVEIAPELFAAALDSHGETDTLRSEFTPNGPPNISEFGSVTTQDGFHGLYAMSAEAHVRDGVKYPGVMGFTGANDPRVAPWEVAKIVAAMQAATSSARPVLLNVSYDSGHGIGSTTSQYVDETTDGLSFLLWQFGDKDFQPKFQN
jgi:prolyl oligopeptidase